MSFSVLLLVLFYVAVVYAELAPLVPQTDTWNSSFEFSTSQLTGTNFLSVQIANIEVALNFERTNWATGSVLTDDFYAVPSNASSLPPGSVINVEPYVNPINYTLPPSTAISRILYTTQNLFNETIPASAVVLWPFLPAQYSNLTGPDPTVNSSRFPLVAWGHGTSGQFSECAPSHVRNLWYQYSAIYELALAGYVVVAPDYQGLGVNATANGSAIIHPTLVARPIANDLLYAVQAAQDAFADLVSKEFVIMGHSQGGAGAWAGAIRQAQQPVEGYLGTISASPPTNTSAIIEELVDVVPPNLAFALGEATKALYPNFSESNMMTDEGVARLRIARDQSMCNSAISQLLADFPGPDNGTLIYTNWTDIPEVQSYLQIADLGIQQIAGPMLVLQGTADPAVPYSLTDLYVAETCTANEGRGIQYARFEGVGHVPILYASQTIWQGFLRELFSAVGSDQSLGTSANRVCVTTNYTSQAMPVENYQKELGYFLSLATSPYQVA